MGVLGLVRVLGLEWVGSPWLSCGAAAAQGMLLLQVTAGLRSVTTMFVLRRSAASYNKMRSDFYLDTDITSCQQVGGGSSVAQYQTDAKQNRPPLNWPNSAACRRHTLIFM